MKWLLEKRITYTYLINPHINGEFIIFWSFRLQRGLLLVLCFWLLTAPVSTLNHHQLISNHSKVFTCRVSEQSCSDWSSTSVFVFLGLSERTSSVINSQEDIPSVSSKKHIKSVLYYTEPSPRLDCNIWFYLRYSTFIYIAYFEQCQRNLLLFPPLTNDKFWNLRNWVFDVPRSSRKYCIANMVTI